MISKFAICIASKDRPDGLLCCLNSLRYLATADFEVLVVDDGSENPLRELIFSEIAPEIRDRITFLRNEESVGYIPVRNYLGRASSSEFSIFLDDDAFLVDNSPLKSIEILTNDQNVAAVAFRQLEGPGSPYPEYMQPAPTDFSCRVASFLGYGHAIRNAAFRELAGYKELLQAYGEEKEFCKRLLNRGWGVVYVPSISVVHSHSPTGRSQLKRIRFSARNSIIDSIFNEPLLMLVVTTPWRLFWAWRWIVRACVHHGEDASGGMRWIVLDILKNRAAILRLRKPLRIRTFLKWRKLRIDHPRYLLETSNLDS